MNITQQLWAAKEWARVKATGNEYVELVHSATNEEKWGPTGQQMEEICISFRTGSQEIMDELRWRLKNRDKSWRSCYKSLLVLDYLARNVSDNYLPEICSLLPTLRTIAQSFYYTNPKGVDHGVSVRERAKNLADLLSDGLLLREERAKALQTKQKLSHNASDCGGPDRFSGLGGNMGGPNSNFYPSSYHPYGDSNFHSINSNALRFNGAGYDPYRPTGSLASRTGNNNNNIHRPSPNSPNSHVPRTREEQERYDLEVALRLQREEERRAGINSTVVEEMYAREAQRRRAAELRDKQETSTTQDYKSKSTGATRTASGNNNNSSSSSNNNNNNNSNNNDKDEDDDEAFARRLQAEEEERARNAGQSLPTLRSDTQEQTSKPSTSFNASSTVTPPPVKKSKKKAKKNKSNATSNDVNEQEETNENEANIDKKCNTAAAANVLDDLFAPAPPPVSTQQQQQTAFNNAFLPVESKPVDPFDAFLDNRVRQQQQQQEFQGQASNMAQMPHAWQNSTMPPSSQQLPNSMNDMNTSYSNNNNNNNNNELTQPMGAAQATFPWTNTNLSNPQNFNPAVNQWGMPMSSAQTLTSNSNNNSNSSNANAFGFSSMPQASAPSMSMNNDSSNINFNMMSNMAVANDIFGGQTPSGQFTNNNNSSSNTNNIMNTQSASVSANNSDNSSATANMWASLDQFAHRKQNEQR